MPSTAIILVLTGQRSAIQREWRVNRGPILLAGVLVVGTCLMVLFALPIAPVSYVVAVRQACILFSVWFGTRGLNESHGRPKWAGAACIKPGDRYRAVSVNSWRRCAGTQCWIRIGRRRH